MTCLNELYQQRRDVLGPALVDRLAASEGLQPTVPPGWTTHGGPPFKAARWLTVGCDEQFREWGTNGVLKPIMRDLPHRWMIDLLTLEVQLGPVELIQGCLDQHDPIGATHGMSL
jgi:hypothetical protein